MIFLGFLYVSLIHRLLLSTATPTPFSVVLSCIMTLCHDCFATSLNCSSVNLADCIARIYSSFFFVIFPLDVGIVTFSINLAPTFIFAG